MSSLKVEVKDGKRIVTDVISKEVEIKGQKIQIKKEVELSRHPVIQSRRILLKDTPAQKAAKLDPK